MSGFHNFYHFAVYHGDDRQPLADDLDCEVILPEEGVPIQLSSSS